MIEYGLFVAVHVSWDSLLDIVDQGLYNVPQSNLDNHGHVPGHFRNPD